MKTADINTTLIERYLILLKNLSSDDKLELIARLSKSMKAIKKPKIIHGNPYSVLLLLTNQQMSLLKD